MLYYSKISFVVVLTALLVVGCGEPTTTPPDGGSAGTDGGTGGTGVGGEGGDGGTGGVVDPCVGVDCSDDNDCTTDATCNPANGACEGLYNKPVDTPCDDDGGSVCNHVAQCVDCNRNAQCPDDTNVCTQPICEEFDCVLRPADGECDFQGQAGVCQAGVCVDANLCAPYPCTDQGDCVGDVCNPATGTCSYPPRPVNTSCNEDGGSVCDGQGNCVECNAASQCADGNPCTYDHCTTNNCSNPAVPNGQSCGTARVCINGGCANDTLGRQVFSGDRGDLANGVHTSRPGFYPWGLAGFYFNFLGSGVDHEVERIQPGFYQDAGGDTAIIARYYDQSGDDSYSWRIDAQRLPFGTQRYYHTGCNQHGFALWDTIGGGFFGVPVLLGFNLDRSTDHNLKTLEIRVFISQSGQLIFSHAFEDEGADDYYCYRVDFAIVPPSRVINLHHFKDSSSRQGSRVQALSGAARPVLQGFRMHYTNGDHHMDQTGVRMEPGQVTVWFNDKNNDDSFTWEIWWADLL